jgi:hypothetical protein
MKNRVLVVFLVAVMCLWLTPAAASDMAADGCQMDEIVWKTGPYPAAGWQTIVGEMHTRIDPFAGTATITFYAHEGYSFAETHLAVAGTLDGIPHSKGGPTPGKFAYGDEWSPRVTEATYVVDISQLPEDDLFVAAHAVVVRDSDGMTETAWGTGCFEPDFAYPGSNWARFYNAWYPKW